MYADELYRVNLHCTKQTNKNSPLCRLFFVSVISPQFYRFPSLFFAVQTTVLCLLNGLSDTGNDKDWMAGSRHKRFLCFGKYRMTKPEDDDSARLTTTEQEDDDRAREQ